MLCCIRRRQLVNLLNIKKPDNVCHKVLERTCIENCMDTCTRVHTIDPRSNDVVSYRYTS